MQQPSVGRVVHALVDPDTNNGSDVAPAVITRVWSESAPGRWTVNYRVLLDERETPWVTSAYLFVDEDTARAQPASSGIHSFWPPRV